MKAQLLEHALEISGAATWEWDIAADSMRYSPNLPRVWGLDPEEFARAGFLALSRRLHPDDRRAYLSAHRDLREGRRMDIVYRGRNDRGVYRWYREVGQTEAENLRVGTVVDVTALKSAEANLALALDVAELGWWSVDLEARTHIWSPRARAIWGVSLDAPARYRFVYNAVFDEQVRSYDLIQTEDGGKLNVNVGNSEIRVFEFPLSWPIRPEGIKRQAEANLSRADYL
ncbi:MAG: PAS domain-containing protein, partial [Alphaproteobacteria bacterium]|nr:PAS domain-containing protein [Alphaproteobacteria bacterium]